jgi:hypothetical protein
MLIEENREEDSLSAAPHFTLFLRSNHTEFP